MPRRRVPRRASGGRASDDAAPGDATCARNPPEVTIVVPVRDGWPHLRLAIASLLAQSHPRVRVMACDDGSVDEGADWLTSVDDPRLAVTRNPSPLGVSTTLNLAFAASRTELVARLDQDDVAEPHRIARQAAVMAARPGCLAVFSQVSRIGEDGRQFGYYRTGREGRVTDYDVDRHGSLLHSTACIRREAFLAVGGYRAALYPADDLDLLLRLSEIGPVAVIEEPLVRYRIHGSAATFAAFAEMQAMARCARAMASHRRAGLPEPDVAVLRSRDGAGGWLGAAGRRLRESGRLAFRRSGMLVGRGELLSGTAMLAKAVALDPRFALGRIFSLRGFRWR